MENNKENIDNNNEDFLSLSLAFGPKTPREVSQVDQPALPLLPPSTQPSSPPQPSSPLRHRHRSRSPPRQRQRHRQREAKSEDIPAPFPWATNRPAVIHSLEYLQSKNIHNITGDVQCRRCDHKYEMTFHLKNKFYEVASFIVRSKHTMYDRAPPVWLQPVLPTCNSCGNENSVKPIIPAEKEKINWLFLLLGQMLGCCTLEQLKYFLEQSKIHRTGAKDRVLYLTYLALCKQLEPKGPFDR